MQGIESGKDTLDRALPMPRINWNRSITTQRWNRWSTGRGPTLFAAWIMAGMGALSIVLLLLLGRWQSLFFPVLYTGTLVAIIVRTPRVPPSP